MTDMAFSNDVQDFITRLDAAEQAHMAWSHRLLRCALLKISPGDDALGDDAHCRCTFGKWFLECQERFNAINPAVTQRLDEQHRNMHDAARNICKDILADVPGRAATIDDFERSQSSMIADLAFLKTQCMAHSARLDFLTGLPLRYSLEEEFQRCRVQTIRRSELLIVLLLDIDHFKHVNDVYGHPNGDLALKHVANLLRSNCRADEPLFRFGGEEFVALLQVPNRSLAQQAAERLLQGLRDAPMHLLDGHLLSLRVSAGLTQAGHDEALADVLERADLALYAAKAAGRDNWQWAHNDA